MASPARRTVSMMDQTAEHSEPRQVVIIEDEPDLANLLAYRFAKEGFTACTASDGQSGLEVIRAGAPHLILLDLLLPVLDGRGVFRALRADPRTRVIPVIIYSAIENQEERDTFLRQGAADFIPKTTSVKEVIARARAALRHSRAGLAA
jgi:two-component system phosphate regulon response regulator PhoB